MSDDELRYIDNPIITMPPRSAKERLRAQLEADIAAFQAEGGVITEVESHIMKDASDPNVDIFSIRKNTLSNNIKDKPHERLTIHTASVYLGIHHATLRHGVRRGHLPDGTPAPTHHKEKGEVYFIPTELEQWKQEQAKTLKEKVG